MSLTSQAKRGTFWGKKIFILLLFLLIPHLSQAAQPLFDARIDYPVLPDPYSVCTADFNGDGYLDLATANYADEISEDSVSILLGNGDGSFQSRVNYFAGYDLYSIIAADLDNDADYDLAVK
jgi:hypothetical protein